MSFLLLTSATAGTGGPVIPPSMPEVLGGGGAWRSFQWPERRERKPVRKRPPAVRVDARLVVALPELAASVVVRNPAPVHVSAQLATPGLPVIHARVRIVTPLQLLEELEAILGVLDD